MRVAQCTPMFRGEEGDGKGNQSVHGRKMSEFHLAGQTQNPREGAVRTSAITNQLLSPQSPKRHRCHDGTPSSSWTVSSQVNIAFRKGPFISNIAKGVSFSQLCENFQSQIRQVFGANCR